MRGSYTWTVPSGVYQISATVYGGGGGSYDNGSFSFEPGFNGEIKTSNINVIPGDNISIIVGEGGISHATYGENGTESVCGILHASGGNGAQYFIYQNPIIYQLYGMGGYDSLGVITPPKSPGKRAADGRDGAVIITKI